MENFRTQLDALIKENLNSADSNNSLLAKYIQNSITGFDLVSGDTVNYKEKLDVIDDSTFEIKKPEVISTTKKQSIKPDLKKGDSVLIYTELPMLLEIYGIEGRVAKAITDYFNHKPIAEVSEIHYDSKINDWVVVLDGFDIPCGAVGKYDLKLNTVNS